MKTKLWTAAAVVLAMSGAAMAGEMTSGSGGGANPASGKGVKTPSQPNETQPGTMSGAGDMKGEKSDKAATGSKAGAKGSAKGEMKGDVMGGGTGMQAGSGSSGLSSGVAPNPGNPAEKGVKTPSQPNETQPGMGSKKK